MPAPHHHRIDPRLRAVPGAPRRKGTAQVFVEVANAAAAKWIESRPWVQRFVHIVDGYYTATISRARVDDLAAREGVLEVEAVRLFRPHLIRSVGSIHGDQAVAGADVPDGKGVVVGIVDYGLDFTLKDFQNTRTTQDAHNPRGITRVAYLWDQQLARRKGEQPPAKYGYGVEYTSRDLDRALRSGNPGRVRHNPLAATDIAGHGTHVAGIAAGNGETTDVDFPRRGEYTGVAPAATIVFVSLNRARVIEGVEGGRGTLANSVDIAHGIAYCFEKADELGMPCVVNLSLGANGGGHDGNMVLEWIIDALVQRSGRAVVLAAGNEDTAAGHAAGSLRVRQTAALEWAIGVPRNPGPGADPDPNPNELEVWYPRGNAITVSLEAPDGVASRVVAPGAQRRSQFPRGREVAIIRSDAATPWNGAARVHIELREGRRGQGIRAGTWRVKLLATRVAAGERGRRVRFDAWIERTLPAGAPGASSFGIPSRTITLTTPSTGRRSIVAAAYENFPPENISQVSSRGPTRDGRFKPELSAPGINVFSTGARAGTLDDEGNVRNARRSLSGTSMASPHVAGVVARMLGVNAYLTADEIRDVLVASAAPRRGLKQGRWNAKEGYGRLDAARAVELVQVLQGERRPPARG